METWWKEYCETPDLIRCFFLYNLQISGSHWCDLQIFNADGAEMPWDFSPMVFVPFSFDYNKVNSGEFLMNWKQEITEEDLGTVLRKKIIFTNPDDATYLVEDAETGLLGEFSGH